jgi:hypothetical protein
MHPRCRVSPDDAMWVEDGEDDDLQLISWESAASRAATAAGQPYDTAAAYGIY